MTDSFASVEELREVVYDAGAQLGRGHTGGLSSGAGAFRAQLVTMADQRYDDYVSIVNELADEMLTDWRALGTSP